MSRRHWIALALALSLLTLPAAAVGPQMEAAGPPSVEESPGGWCAVWAEAWASLWSRWGPPGAGDVPGDAVRTPADERDDGGVGSVNAATCSQQDPDDSSCESYPDWDPYG